MMNILLTNDDGIDGEGLRVLYERLSLLPNVHLYVMAPDSNRSAVSSLLTMMKPMKFVKKSERVFSCSGSPVDCVISSMCSNVFANSECADENGFVKFDAVISGINKGANLGTDVVYSGTCAAARQSVLYNVPGIALSVESYDGTWNFNAMANFCAENLEKLISLSTSMLFVSVNGRSSDKYNEAVFTLPSIRNYGDRFKIISDPSGNENVSYGFFVSGEIKTFAKEKTDFELSDFSVSKNNKVSITRIYAEPFSENDLGLSF